MLLSSAGTLMIHPDAKKLKRQSIFTLIKDDNPAIKEAAKAMIPIR